MASRSKGSNFSPQALKPNCTAARAPVASSSVKIGPESRIHESSMPSSTTSTLAASAARASAASAASATTIVTGSKAATALATPAYCTFAAASSVPQSSRRQGQPMSVRSCGAHSGGITAVTSPCASGS